MGRYMGVIALLGPLLLCCSALSSSIDEPHTLKWLNRPNVYAGVRARTPNSPLIGLMWYNMDRFDASDHIRHDCDERDKFTRYGWTHHDGRSFGVQELADVFSGVNITTEWVKHRENDAEENWVLRVTGEPVHGHKDRNVSVIWYVAAAGEGHTLKVSPELKNNSETGIPAGTVYGVSGHGSDAGDYTIVVQDGDGNKHPRVRVPNTNPEEIHRIADDWSYLGVETDSGNVWDAKQFVRAELQRVNQEDLMTYWSWMQRDFPENYRPRIKDFPKVTPFFSNKFDSESSNNLFLFQRMFALPFSFELSLTSTHLEGSDEMEQSLLDAKRFDELLQNARGNFDEKFEGIFGLEKRKLKAWPKRAAKAALSNMLGGIGYFHGKSLLQLRDAPTKPDGSPNVVWKEATSLYATVPSRSYFPRGFYWDEGFHQLLVSRFDAEISQEIIRSWYNLIDEEGWIGREQILGAEARSRVPSEFQVQHPDVANPPTIIVALHQILERQHAAATSDAAAGDVEVDATGKATSAAGSCEGDAALCGDGGERDSWLAFLIEVYPRIKLHVDWYLRTQKSPSDESTFMWKGCTEKGCLPSGLDDYPRAPWPSKDQGHVDLHCWMIVLCDTMAEIASMTGNDKDAIHYSALEDEYRSTLPELYWNPEAKAYNDFAVHPNKTEREFIVHRGYISLFPLALQLLDHDDPNLGDILKSLTVDLEDEKSTGVLSKYGVRSLAVSDPAFGTGDNYWRGPHWINLNYLIVRALHHYGAPSPSESTGDPEFDALHPFASDARTLYKRLRGSLLKNIVREYKRTGYLWEQYDPKDGKGKRSHPFTGWTALVLNIMGEEY